MQNKHKLFLEALEKSYCACMFDFDGTLTKRKSKSPVPKSLKKVLQKLSKTVPMALCTARPIKTAYPKLTEIFDGAGDKIKQNWFLIAENGALGYKFDKNKLVEFYRINWPEKLINKKLFYGKIKNNLKKYIKIFQSNKTNLIFQPHYENASDGEIARRCDFLEKEIKKILSGFKNAGAIKIVNSKLGIIIIPANADKDRGIVEFSKYLAAMHNKKFSKNYREIITVGDQPGKGGNDKMFLKGKFGMPFTAGEILKSKYPIGIFKNPNTRLTGPKSTEYLLKSVKFC